MSNRQRTSVIQEIVILRSTAGATKDLRPERSFARSLA
jgi:hypothetical protein